MGKQRWFLAYFSPLLLPLLTSSDQVLTVVANVPPERFNCPYRTLQGIPRSASQVARPFAVMPRVWYVATVLYLKTSTTTDVNTLGPQ
jgi:hypothetical protein